MSPVGISSKRPNCEIGVAFPISLEKSVARRQFVALMSLVEIYPQQGLINRNRV